MAVTSASGEWSGHGQGSRHRPGNDELGDRGDGRWPAAGHPQRGGQPDDAVRGRLPGERRATGRPDGPTPGDPEPEGDDLLREALHRPQVRRGQQRADHRLVRRGRRSRRRGALPGQRQALRTRGDLGAGASEAGRRRREVPRRAGHRGGHHRPGALQRRAATGHQGRRQDRRARSPPDHQRADGCSPGLRDGQARERDRAGLRPRRRHLRRQHPDRRRGRGRGPVDGRGHASRRRRLRPAHRRLPGRRLQEVQRHRPPRRLPGPAASVRGCREGQGGAVGGHPDRRQPPVRHR